MKKNKMKWAVPFIIFLFVFQSTAAVKADDDDYEEYGGHEKYQQWENEDDGRDDFWEGAEEDDEEWEQRGDSYINSNQLNPKTSMDLTSYWNIWTREMGNSSNENLPFQVAKEIKIGLNGQLQSFFIIPQNGQLLISGKKMAQLLQVEVKYYEQSRILELSKDNKELIVRAGTNAAYENMVKTPMPANALYYENTVYLPISVIANAFGYGISWDVANEIINVQKM